MIKVLLVDDEKLALDFLEHIINWEYHDFHIIGITSDAEHALRLFRQHKPELIISDIKMPTMSGLELAAMVRELDKRVHILFLSGYKNFSYVSQAIRLGIDDYILKSDVNEETFLRKIMKLKEDIEKEQAKNQYTMDIILEALFKKDIPEEQYKHILDEGEFIRINKRYYYLILAKNTIPEFMELYIATETKQNFFDEIEFKKLCAFYIAEEDMYLISAFAVNEKTYLAVIEMKESIVSQRKADGIMYRLSLCMLNYMKEYSGLQFSIYYYAKKCSVRQFGRFYEEKQQQLWKRYINTRPRVIEFGKDDTIQDGNKNIASISEEELYLFIKNTKSAELDQYLEALKSAVKREDYVTYLWYVKNLFHALKRFEGVLLGEMSKRRFSLTESSGMYDFSNPQEVIDFFVFKLEEIKIILSERNRESYSAVIEEAFAYIQENYSCHELTVYMVAQHVNLSNSWLSTKFKEEVGVGVSDYLNGIRIEKAKQLIQGKSYMVYEVAEMTGFTSSQYFSKIFKQYTGKTPNEYKRSMKQVKV